MKPVQYDIRIGWCGAGFYESTGLAWTPSDLSRAVSWVVLQSRNRVEARDLSTGTLYRFKPKAPA